MSLQIGSKLIQTFYLSSGWDITLTPHIGYIVSGYCGPFLGTHASIGIPVTEKVAVRPEAGIANIDFSEDWDVNL
ncbi:MAG: hypothetical protein JW863_21665 [Chitinispirillaceae bacterium]|nr:hypothetical protein [Chitinispirillaceae bacterium]